MGMHVNHAILPPPSATLPSEKKTAETGVSLLSRRAASALGLRPLQPYVPLRCGPSAGALWRDTPVSAYLFSSDRRNIDQCKFLNICILKTGDQRLSGIDRCQHVHACLDGISADDDGFVIRRNAIETGVNVLTAIDTARALITSLENTDIKKLTLIDIATI